MKRISIIQIYVLSTCIILHLLSCPGFAEAPQGVGRLSKSNERTTATLIITEFTTLFGTERGELFSSALPILIKIALQGDQYNWLRVVTDTSSRFPKEMTKFFISGTIIDLSGDLKLDLKIKIIDRPDKEDTTTYKSYLVAEDSTLVQIDRIAKELGSLAQKEVSVSEEREKLKVLIFPFKNISQDTLLNEVGEYIASSLRLKLEMLPIISNAIVDSAASRSDRTFKKFDLILKGSFDMDEDSATVSANMVDARSDKTLYTARTRLDVYDLIEAPEYLVGEFGSFFLTYRDIRDELLAKKSAKEFHERGEEYSRDTADSRAKEKAELMFQKALEDNSQYIPALASLGDIYLDEKKYDDALSNYRRILEIDSLRVDAHYGIGEVFYFLNEDSAARQNYEHAAELAKSEGNQSAVARAFRRLGELSTASSNFDESISYYYNALQLNEEDLWIWYGIANAHYLRYSESIRRIHDTTDLYLAVDYFQRGGKKFPEDTTFPRNTAYIYNYWGVEYYNEYSVSKNDTVVSKENRTLLLDLSREKFEKAILFDSYDNDLKAKSLNYLAWFAFKEYQDDKAKDLSRRAVDVNPSDEWTYRLFAHLHKDDSANIDKALEAINRALQIDNKAVSNEIRGDIYFTMAEYDSSFVAYQRAVDMGRSSILSIEGLSKSAKETGFPNNIKIAIGYLNSELEIYPTERLYINWLTELERIDNKYENVEPALNKYIQQDITRYDSLWAYERLAEASREQHNYNEALRYVEKSFKLIPNSIGVFAILDSLHSSAAFAILDSLYFADSFEPALQLKINRLKNKVKGNGTLSEYLTLGYAYLDANSDEKSLDALEMAFRSAKSESDTAFAVVLRARIFFDQGKAKYKKGDTSAARRDFVEATVYFHEAAEYYREAIDNFQEASNLLYALKYTLDQLGFIYHDYLIDYQRSYDIFKELLSFESLNTGYIANAIEATLTSGRFDSTSILAKGILFADSLGQDSLTRDRKLAIKFILMASLVLNGDIVEGSFQFGEFKRLYEKRPPEEKAMSWNWGGTEHFLKTYKNVNSSHRKLLLDMLSALRSTKEEGMEFIKEAETSWKNLLTEKN